MTFSRAKKRIVRRVSGEIVYRETMVADCASATFVNNAPFPLIIRATSRLPVYTVGTVWGIRRDDFSRTPSDVTLVTEPMMYGGAGCWPVFQRTFRENVKKKKKNASAKPNVRREYTGVYVAYAAGDRMPSTDGDRHDSGRVRPFGDHLRARVFQIMPIVRHVRRTNDGTGQFEKRANDRHVIRNRLLHRYTETSGLLTVLEGWGGRKVFHLKKNVRKTQISNASIIRLDKWSVYFVRRIIRTFNGGAISSLMM